MIENTSGRDPSDHVVGMAAGGTKYITGMEAAGQQQILRSEVLPSDMGDRSAYEALGFTFGDPVEGDPIFITATLPEGWERKGSSHSMWTYLVDERGIERVAIFYKAAFYDRSAHMSMTNVGYRLANDFVYGEGPSDEVMALLTDDERQSFVKRLEQYVKDAEEHPKIYTEGEAVKKKLDSLR